MYNHALENYVCPFCQVVRGEENERLLTRRDDVFYRDHFITAFIASGGFTNNRGHVLIIPNRHIENIYDLPDGLSVRIHLFEKDVALALKEVYRCDGVSTRQHNEPAGSQDVFHYHLHVIPRYEGDNFYSSEKVPNLPRERAERARMLREYFQSVGYPKGRNVSHLFGSSVILYKDGKILLQRRRDNGLWGYHGGRVELGERVEDAARRELFEETGLTAGSLELLGVFSGPGQHHVYPDGNEVEIIQTVYLCDDFSGTELMQQEECLDLKWFDMRDIPENLTPSNIAALTQFIQTQGTV